MSGWGPSGGGYGPPGGGGFGPPPPGMGGPVGPSPYGPPMGMVPGGGMGEPDPGATGKLAGPAITMMVLTGIGMAFGLFSMAANVFGIAVAPGGQDQVAQLMSGCIGIVMNLVALACGGFALFGLNQMRQARSWGLSLAAVIISMVPCLGACWCINLFVGIWALLVLNEAPVKSAFSG
jgi:hypothetical protein